MLDELEQLREALKTSPQNLYLRKLYAAALMKATRLEEAELEWKECLKLSPNEPDSVAGLATTFLEQRKIGLGLVLLEDSVQSNKLSASGWLVYAKLLLKSKQIEEAKNAYQTAIAIAPSLKDAFLEAEINNLNQHQVKPEPEKVKMGGFDESGMPTDRIVEFERPKINFDHVGGMDNLKEEIRMKIIFPLEHPEIYKAYGKKIGGGILMYGPPGCGKTHLARATAGAINANFISVGINDILDMYLGNSERNLHAIFEKARSISPCVLFFDEADALGANRTDMRHSAGRHLINQFLSELDGIEYNNDGILILAATNAPWHLDPAFRRPGRFDRIIFVPPPDVAARTSILQLKLQNKPTDNVQLQKIVQQTEGFSGADLEAVIDIAIESKLMESMKKGKPVPLETSDLLNATKKHKATTKEWFLTAKNYALFANEGGLYDDILTYLKYKK